MGKILNFIYNDMADFEITLACHLAYFTEREIVTIAYEKEIVKSKPGIQYYPHSTVADALLMEDVDALIIPGGWNNEVRPELIELIRKLNNQKKLLCAICAGPKFLAYSGILKGRSYTTSLSQEAIKNMGIEDPFPRETYVEKRIVRDENIITSQGYAFVDFAVEIGDYFNLFSDEEDKKQYKMQITNCD